MSLTSTVPLGRRLLVAGLGVVLVAAGILLAPRPLSALVVLLGMTATALAVWGISLIRHARGRRGPWVAALVLGAAAVLILVFLPQVARALPAVIAAVLAGNAVRLLVRVVREGPLIDRLIRIAFTLASGAGAVLVWLWPDVALVATGSAFGASLVLLGLFALLRSARRGKPKKTWARTVPAALRVAPRIAGAIVALAVATAASYATVSLRANITPVDDFYAWEGDVPAAPGALLRVRPYAGVLPDGAKAFRILYATTYADGTPALGSAVIAFPTAPADMGRTVIAWQHGTTGVARSCAPSADSQALTEYAIPGISRAIDRGWAIVAADYPGQGTGGRYPYLIGEGEGRSALDAVRAIRQFDEADASGRVMIWGHSQGGHATLWAGELADQYAPELEVAGVAALSAAADPLLMAERVTGSAEGPLTDLITSFVLVPYSDEYSDVDLGASVHPAGQSIVTAFASRCVNDSTTLASVLVGLSLRLDAPLYRVDVTSGATRDRLAQNIADGVVPAPLFLGQGADDEVIPESIQTSLAEGLCGQDRPVETHLYPGRTHMGVIAEGSPLIDDLFAWADAVASGERPSTCGR